MGDPSRDDVRSRLLSWYGANRRDLPWRRSRDPYRILVAEYLLQRTRIASGTPYYERFLERFPTVRDLAAAPFDDVLTVWEGLGFYGRARNLHVAAQAVVEQHRGIIPRSYHDLMALPGIGPYTAGAVASIAFGIAVPAVDGNVVRVIARLFRIRENVTSEMVRRRITEITSQLVPREQPGGERSGPSEIADLKRTIRTQAGIQVRVGPRWSRVNRTFSHRKWSGSIYRCSPAGRPKGKTDSVRWILREEALRLPLVPFHR